MTALTEDQLKACGTALAFYPLSFTVSDVDDRATCDSLVARGNLKSVEGVDGGYIAAPELLAAMARQAGSN